MSRKYWKYCHVPPWFYRFYHDDVFNLSTSLYDNMFWIPQTRVINCWIWRSVVDTVVQRKALRPGCHGFKLNKAHYQYIWNDRTVPGWVWSQCGLELGGSLTSVSDTLVFFLTRFPKCFSRDLRQVTSCSKIYAIIFWWVFSFGVLNVVPEFLPDIHSETEIGV